MALIAAHLSDSVYNLPLPPPPYPLSPILPVPNKPYDFCGRYAPCLLTYKRNMQMKKEERFFFFSWRWVRFPFNSQSETAAASWCSVAAIVPFLHHSFRRP